MGLRAWQSLVLIPSRRSSKRTFYRPSTPLWSLRYFGGYLSGNHFRNSRPEEGRLRAARGPVPAILRSSSSPGESWAQPCPVRVSSPTRERLREEKPMKATALPPWAAPVLALFVTFSQEAAGEVAESAGHPGRS